MQEQKPARSHLRSRESYVVARWIDDHGSETATMTLAEISDAVTKATGINTTPANIRGICKANGFPFAALHNRVTDPSRLSASKQTRFLAMTVRRLSLQIEELYEKVGEQIPERIAINKEALVRLSRGFAGSEPAQDYYQP